MLAAGEALAASPHADDRGRTTAALGRRARAPGAALRSDVVARLKAAGVIEREPKAPRDLQAVQAAFNALRQAPGRPLCQLSAMLSLSIHPMF